MTYWLIIGCIIILFGAVAFRGAPYVPTLRREVKSAIDLLDLGPDDLVIDLGSGDGKILQAAAARGYRALGYELNPVLLIISKLRTLRQRRRITVQWRDFWLADWPQDTKAVFVFLAGPFMAHLSQKLHQEMSHRTTPLIVVSHGFAIPGYLPKKIQDGMYLYELQPNRNEHEAQWNAKPRPKIFQKPRFLK